MAWIDISLKKTQKYPRSPWNISNIVSHEGNANENHNKICHFTPRRMGIILKDRNKTKKEQVSWGIRGNKNSHILYWKNNGSVNVKKTLLVSPKLYNYHMTQKFYPYLYPKELKTSTQINTCTFLFLIALFKRTKRWKQSRYPSAHERMNKLWSIQQSNTIQPTKEERKCWCLLHGSGTWEKPCVKEASYKRLHVVWFHSCEIARTGKSMEI